MGGFKEEFYRSLKEDYEKAVGEMMDVEKPRFGLHMFERYPIIYEFFLEEEEKLLEEESKKKEDPFKSLVQGYRTLDPTLSFRERAEKLLTLIKSYDKKTNPFNGERCKAIQNIQYLEAAYNSLLQSIIMKKAMTFFYNHGCTLKRLDSYNKKESKTDIDTALEADKELDALSVDGDSKSKVKKSDRTKDEVINLIDYYLQRKGVYISEIFTGKAVGNGNADANEVYAAARSLLWLSKSCESAGESQKRMDNDF